MSTIGYKQMVESINAALALLSRSEVNTMAILLSMICGLLIDRLFVFGSIFRINAIGHW